MKIKVTILFCCCAILLTLLFRSKVHELTLSAGQFDRKVENAVDAGHMVKVLYHDRRPYYLNFQGEVHGVVADPVALVFEKAEIPFHWSNTPAKRQLEIIRKNSEKTCAAGWFKTPERENYGKYTLPVYQDRQLVAITRADNDLIGELEEIETLFTERRQILLVKYGYSYGDYIDKMIQKMSPRRVVTTADNKSMLQMILAHRADYCFMNEEEANDLLLFAGIHKADFKITVLADVSQGNKRYLICSQKVGDDEIAKLNSAIAYFLNISESEK